MWLGEESTRLGISLKLSADRVLVRTKSRFFKNIIVAENRIFGRFLVFQEGDSWTMQVSEKFDFYSEMLVHVPMTAHEDPRKVLIIGGGDGSTLCQVLKHRSVEQVTLVDIDEKVVEIGAKYMFPDCFKDERVKIIIRDAKEFLFESKEKYDVIIGDYSDPYPDQPAKTLVQKEFYEMLARRLNDNGIASMQAGSPILQPEITRRVYTGMSSVFRKASLYCSPVSVYPGGIWCYAIGSYSVNYEDPRRDYEGKYYNKDIHRASFVLPSFIKEILGII